MAKISNRNIYEPDKNLTGREFWTLTNEDGKTVTLDITEVGNFILGNSGIQNPDGTYTWIKYAEDINGLNMRDEPDINTPYIGLAYFKEVSTESSDPADYLWGLIDGENYYTDDNNVKQYTWIKYADTPQLGMVELPFGKAYIGLRYNNATPTETSVYEDYTWHLRKGMRAYSDQNNFVRVIDIYESDLLSVDSIGIATWINENGLTVAENEIVMFNIILEDAPDEEILSLDLSIPLVLSVSDVTTSTAKLSWNANNDPAIDRFVLIVSNTQTSQVQSYNLKSTDILYLLTNLDDGVKYNAQIIAYDLLNNQKISNTVEFTTEEEFVAATPKLRARNVTDSTVDLSWTVDPAFGADSYELYQDGIKIYDGTDLSYQQTSLAESTSYDFHLIAYNGATPSNQSATVTVTTLASVDPPLSKPTIKLMSKGRDFIIVSADMPELEWNRVEDGGNSKAFYRQLGASQWSEVPYRYLYEYFNKATITGLNTSTVYEVRVQLADKNTGVLSPFSDTIQVTTDEALTGLIKIILANPDLDDEGLMTVLGGGPGEEIEINLKMAFVGQESYYDVQMKAVVNGTDYIVSVSSASPTSTTVRIPITLDSEGMYGSVKSVVNNLFASGGHSVDDPTSHIRCIMQVVSRSQGDLSPFSHTMNFYLGENNNYL